MKWIKNISRRSNLTPTYSMWEGLIKHENTLFAEFNNKRWDIYHEEDCMAAYCDRNTNNVLNKPNFIEDYLKNSINLSNEAFNFSEKVKNTDLSRLTNKDLAMLFSEYHIFLMEFGKTITKARFGALKPVEDYLKKKTGKENVGDLIVDMTYPDKKSFNAVEEIELLLMALEIKIKNLSEHETNELIKNHLEKWEWIPTNWLLKKPWDLNDIKQRLSQITEPLKRLNEIQTEFNRRLQLKKELREKHIDSENIMKLLNWVEAEVFYRLYRRFSISKTLHNTRNLFSELAKRMNIDIELIYNLTPKEIDDFLTSNHMPNINLVKKRLDYYVFYSDENGINLLYDNEAVEFIKREINKQIDKNISELKGTVGCKGFVKGKVKVVMDEKDYNKVERGDILVTNETTPDFIPILGKVSAIITDEGGMTCHAAIVSREMNIPCIIGTKIATEIFKDHDLIEVDAEKGIIRKLK